jgi:ceramide glucosyltransferase
MRTMRAIAPLGHAFLFLTYAIPMTLIATLVTRGSPVSLALLAAAVVLRVVLHWIGAGNTVGDTRTERSPLWTVVMRDILGLVIWVLSFGTRTVVWRGRSFRVDHSGVLHPLTDS